jgi:hypothetical protein
MKNLVKNSRDDEIIHVNNWVDSICEFFFNFLIKQKQIDLSEYDPTMWGMNWFIVSDKNKILVNKRKNKERVRKYFIIREKGRNYRIYDLNSDFINLVWKQWNAFKKKL